MALEKEMTQYLAKYDYTCFVIYVTSANPHSPFNLCGHEFGQSKRVSSGDN